MLTQHAQVRAQQRGIPPLLIQWLIEFGSEAKAPGGAMRLHFDRAARKRLAKAVGAQIVDRLGSLLDAYLVEANETGRVITVAHRIDRIRKH